MRLKGIDIKGITSEPWKVKPGYLFVHTRKNGYYGVEQISDAIRLGASLIFTEMEYPVSHEGVIKVKDSSKLLGFLSSRFFGFPSDRLMLIGVIGDKGKTTVVHMLEGILTMGGLEVGFCSSLVNKAGDYYSPPLVDEPLPERLNRELYNMVIRKIDIGIIEIPNSVIGESWLTNIKFDVIICTNHYSSPSNDIHRSFVGLKGKTVDTDNPRILILNGDDGLNTGVLDMTQKPYIISYGLNPKSSITASSIEQDKGTRFTYCIQRGVRTMNKNFIEPQEFPVSLMVTGQHNVYNALSAVTAALICDIPIPTIQRSLSEFFGLKRRQEIIFNNDYIVIDDCCNTAESYETLFKVIQEMNYKRLWLVIEPDYRLTMDQTFKLVQLINNWSVTLNIVQITVLDDRSLSRNFVDPSQKRNKTVNIIMDMLKQSHAALKRIGTLKEAVSINLNRIRKGDIMVLAGNRLMEQGAGVFMELLFQDNEPKEPGSTAPLSKKHVIIDHLPEYL
ncbi:MAG: Mur ligase family protein [Mahellales bacterium]|jgi:UDP-N-acetylmuramoyl-L-alanyl-D-glutamate--2,6-diaminopimelate ligase